MPSFHIWCSQKNITFSARTYEELGFVDAENRTEKLEIVLKAA
ncbi:MAG: hypothetical protein QXR44_05455 [Thermoproteota archaeon]